MWNQPYLETCCRAALHRLHLAGATGRSAALLDGACLRRLATMGLSRQQADGTFVITPAGRRRHGQEVLKQPRETPVTTTAR